MYNITRRLRKWLYRIVKEEEEIQEAATDWHRVVKIIPCVYCTRPIPPDSLFCNHCGFALAKMEQQTTGAQKLVTSLPMEHVATIALPKPRGPLTSEIEAAINPDEKYSRMKAYNRMKKAGTGIK